jgi:hypothetical protein
MEWLRDTSSAVPTCSDETAPGGAATYPDVGLDLEPSGMEYTNIPDRFLKEGHIMVTKTGNILELAYPNGADIQTSAPHGARVARPGDR